MSAGQPRLSPTISARGAPLLPAFYCSVGAADWSTCRNRVAVERSCHVGFQNALVGLDRGAGGCRLVRRIVRRLVRRLFVGRATATDRRINRAPRPRLRFNRPSNSPRPKRKNSRRHSTKSSSLTLPSLTPGNPSNKPRLKNRIKRIRIRNRSNRLPLPPRTSSNRPRANRRLSRSRQRSRRNPPRPHRQARERSTGSGASSTPATMAGRARSRASTALSAFRPSRCGSLRLQSVTMR